MTAIEMVLIGPALGVGVAVAMFSGPAVVRRLARGDLLERARRRSAAALAGRHRPLPPAAAAEVAAHDAAAEVWRADDPVVGEIVELSPVEPRRSDYARRLFEDDPLSAPMCPDKDAARAVLFESTVERQTLYGHLLESTAADLETTGAWKAATVRRLAEQARGAR